MTTSRVSGFGGSSGFGWPAGGAGAAGAAGAGIDSAAPMGTGPCVSLALSFSTLPEVNIPARSVSPQLLAELSMNGCAVRLLTPPLTGVTDRANGYAVSSRKPSTMGCAG